MTASSCKKNYTQSHHNSLDTHTQVLPWPKLISKFILFYTYWDGHVCIVNLIDAVPQILGIDLLSSLLKIVIVVIVVASQNIAVNAWHQNQAVYYLHFRFGTTLTLMVLAFKQMDLLDNCTEFDGLRKEKEDC